MIIPCVYMSACINIDSQCLKTNPKVNTCAYDSADGNLSARESSSNVVCRHISSIVFKPKNKKVCVREII